MRTRVALPALFLLAAACSPSGPADTPGPADEPAPSPDTQAAPAEVTLQEEPAADSGLVAEGRSLAQANCAGCHALDESSDSTHPDAPPFRTLSELYPLDSLQEALVEGIIVGHPDMPEFRFQPSEADALIAFLKTIQTGEAD